MDRDSIVLYVTVLRTRNGRVKILKVGRIVGYEESNFIPPYSLLTI